MKTSHKLSLAVVSVVTAACVGLAQTPSQFIPRVNGNGINAGQNTALLGNTRIGAGNIISNAVIHEEFRLGNGVTNFGVYPLLGGAVFVALGTTAGGFGNLGGSTFYAWTFQTNVVMLGGRFIGDASGATNIPGTGINYPTNLASETTIDYAEPILSRAISGNISISGRTGFVPTAFNRALRNFTNTTAAAVTVTMASTFANMSPIDGLTLYCTNVGQLLVYEQTGFGTNFYWKSR